MSVQKIVKPLVITAILLLVLGLLPGISALGAGVDSGPAKVGPASAGLTPTPSAPLEGPVVRPPASFEDMIVQFGESSGDTSAQSDNSGVEIVPAAAFIHTGQVGNGTEGEDWFFSFSSGSVWNDSANQVCLAAPVYLPPGSVIQSFTAYVYDNSASNDLVIFFDRTGSWGGWNELGAVMSVSSNTSIQTLTDPSISAEGGANVVAPEYNYHVDFCFPAASSADIGVFGARIDYSPASAPGPANIYLPIIIKPSNATTLYIKNSSGGVIFFYRVYDAPQGSLLIQCPGNIQNGAQVLCGTFPAGNRHVVLDGTCGPGSGTVVFPAGTCTRTIGCDRKPTTMVCN
jgi:hypothetical protein